MARLDSNYATARNTRYSLSKRWSYVNLNRLYPAVVSGKAVKSAASALRLTKSEIELVLRRRPHLNQ